MNWHSSFFPPRELINICIHTGKSEQLDSVLIPGTPALEKKAYHLTWYYQCLSSSSKGKALGEEREAIFIFVNYWLNHAYSV